MRAREPCVKRCVKFRSGSHSRDIWEVHPPRWDSGAGREFGPPAP